MVMVVPLGVVEVAAGFVPVPDPRPLFGDHDQAGRRGLVQQEARLVPGDEDRAHATHQPPLAGQLVARLLCAVGVPLCREVVALCDVQLDEVLSHGSTVLAGIRVRRNYGGPEEIGGPDPRTRPQVTAQERRSSDQSSTSWSLEASWTRDRMPSLA